MPRAMYVGGCGLTFHVVGGLEPFFRAALQQRIERAAVGELQGLQRRSQTVAAGDDLLAVGAAEGAGQAGRR
jgi:hypothetical protein